MTLRDLSAKDVIQLKTGENLGRIDDVVFDEHGGQLQSVILRGRAHCFGLLGCDDDLILPWESIRTIGTDVIMVDAGPLPGTADVCESYILCKIPQKSAVFFGILCYN